MLSAYFLFTYLESRKNRELFLMSLFLGIGIMVKLYVAFFAVSFIIFLAILEFKNNKSYKKTAKTILFVCAILFVLCLPTFTHNYLLYKDKGFTDLIFTNTFHLGLEKAQSLYSWSAGFLPHSDYAGFFIGNQKNFDPTPIPGFIIVLGMLLRGDPLLFIVGLIGIVLAFRRNKQYFWFYLLFFIPAFIYLGAQIPMAKHFVWALVMISPLAGISLEALLNKTPKIRLNYILIAILIFNLLFLGMPKDVAHAHFYGESSFGRLVDFKSNIPKDALVVADSRIYRGNIHFGLLGTNYIEASQFMSIADELNARGNLKSTDVYYIECVVDDCGWGTVQDQPEFNKSMESITSQIANLSYYSINFTGPDTKSYYLPFFKDGITEYRIYKVQLALNPLIFQAAKQTHSWFLYPVGYDRTISEIFDDYSGYNAFDNLLNKTSKLILYAEIIISFLAILYIGYLFVKE